MVDMFERLGNDPAEWRSTAEALAYNATVLTEHRHGHQEDVDRCQQALKISPVDMLFASLVLWGYAVECLLKCLWLKTGHRLVESGQLGCWGRHHNLVAMAGELPLQLTDSQQRILASLSTIVTWSGRYPIATSKQGMSLAHYWCDPEDDSVLEELVEALRLAISKP